MFLAQKSTLGHSRDALFDDFACFFTDRKNVEFSMQIWTVKKSRKIDPWTPKGLKACSGPARGCPFSAQAPQGGPRARIISSKKPEKIPVKKQQLKYRYCQTSRRI